MAQNAALSVAEQSDEAPVVNPLRAWREQQLVTVDGARIVRAILREEGKKPIRSDFADVPDELTRTWTIADAARFYSEFIGRPVAYHVWRGWEQHRDAPDSRIPNFDDMRGIASFTGGAVTANDFYGLAGGQSGPAEAEAGG